MCLVCSAAADADVVVDDNDDHADDTVSAEVE